MPFSSAPPLDDRPKDEIIATTQKLATAFSGHQPGSTPDLGSALIRIFARMAGEVQDRLNRVPDRNFLAFLNMVGVEPLPPRPARVALTFSPVAGGTVDAVVPKGTRVGASPVDGDPAEVVFEATRELVTTRATLTAVIARQPDAERYADRTAQALGSMPGFYPAFTGNTAIDHCLYVAANEIFALPAGKAVTLTMNLAPTDVAAWQALHAQVGGAPPLVVWSYWDGAAWQSLPQLAVSVPGPVGPFLLTFVMPQAIVPTSINGRTARWVRARLTAFPSTPVPALQSITVSATLTGTGLAPDLALQNGRPLDLGMDFFPLGEQPRFNDSFYLASSAVFGRPQATVTLTLTQSSERVAMKSTDNPTIAWEALTRDGWVLLGKSTPTTVTPGAANTLFTDTTQAFKTGKTAGPNADTAVSFTVPAGAGAAPVQGISSCWIRARLASGSYGTGITVVTTTTAGVTTTTVNNDGYRPPLFTKVTIDFTHAATYPADAIVTQNDLLFTDRSGSGASLVPLAPFIPFTRSADALPTLYLGFDRPFDNRLMLLYVEVPPLVPDAAQSTTPAVAAQVVWEYATALGWARLGATDETRGFTRSGLVEFIGPLDFVARTELGQRLYWLRARWDSGAFLVAPRLGRIATNTVWATHTNTITGELLGASDESANQVFKTAAAPVLSGQQIEVRENAVPSPDEQAALAALAALEGDGASTSVTIVTDVDGQPEEVWVRWHGVSDFGASGPRDRHYTINRASGEICFGDGQRGMIPPRGANRVRAAQYQTGGGVVGNRAANTITSLKTTVSYVDAVTNAAPSTGGADGDGAAELQTRAPRILRHGYRAIAAEDFEDLAREASAQVARVRAITPRFDPGLLADNPDATVAGAGVVGLILVPFGTEAQPTPTLGLIQDVQSYLEARAAPAISLQISGPDWVQVTVTVDIIPTAKADASMFVAQVRSAIERFLHPLTGGPDGTGWEFGRLPHESDLHAVLNAVPGVDHVQNLAILQSPAGAQSTSRVLIFSGSHDVRVLAAGEAG